MPHEVKCHKVPHMEVLTGDIKSSSGRGLGSILALHHTVFNSTYFASQTTFLYQFSTTVQICLTKNAGKAFYEDK